MSELAGRDFRHILLIKPSSPGDIIHALPVLHGLRRRYPAAHLAWLVASPFAELIAVDPALDEVVPFDRKRFGFLGRSIRVTGEFLTFLRELRGKRFDLVIDLQGLFRSGFLAMASGARTRIGFAASRELAWMFYTDRIPSSPPDTHAAERNWRVAGMLGFSDGPMDFTVHLTAEDRAAAEALRAEAQGRAGERYAVLVPGTRWETKVWAPRRFGELAALIRERHGLSSLLVGGAGDGPAAREVVAASGGAAVDLCGRTTLRQAAALIERAAVVVTADSTPMHLAVVMNRPLVALFGPTNPRRTGPYGRLNDVLRVDLPCSPCYYRRLRQCPHDHACMAGLEAEAVSLRIAAALSTRP